MKGGAFTLGCWKGRNVSWCLYLSHPLWQIHDNYVISPMKSWTFTSHPAKKSWRIRTSIITTVNYCLRTPRNCNESTVFNKEANLLSTSHHLHPLRLLLLQHPLMSWYSIISARVITSKEPGYKFYHPQIVLDKKAGHHQFIHVMLLSLTDISDYFMKHYWSNRKYEIKPLIVRFHSMGGNLHHVEVKVM